DVEPQPNLPLQEIIILNPDDQPMWENAKIVAPAPNSAIVQPNVDDNLVINSTHLQMIWENKFDGYLWTDPHDHIREFLAICDMFKYGKTKSEAVKLLMFPLSLCDKAKICNDDNYQLMEKLEALTIKMDSQFQSLKEEMHEMRKNYNNHGGDNASKNDDTSMCERHEVNYIQSGGYRNQNSNDSYYDPKSNNDYEKSLRESNNDVKK
ncbi:hypothetical protein Tco_1329175, partial [Tanacetum coccineum]